MHEVRSYYVTNDNWLLKNITRLKLEISTLHPIKTTLYIIVGMFSLISIQFHPFQSTTYQELGFQRRRTRSC